MYMSCHLILVVTCLHKASAKPPSVPVVEMSDHSRSLFSTWVALFLSLGSIACSYVVVITATTLAQPSFMYASQSQQSFRA